MLRRFGLVTVLAVMPVLWAAATVPPSPNLSGSLPSTPTTTTAAAPTGDGYETVVTSTGLTGGSVPFQRTVRVRVPAMCWMTPGLTGIEYAIEWQPGGPSFEKNARGGYPWEHLVYDKYMEHATSQGRWYTSTCRVDAPPQYIVNYQNSHPPLFVEPTEPAPRADAVIDPLILAQAARDAMTLPTGTIRWNPDLEGSHATLVNMDTFVWIEGSTDAVQIRAEVIETGTWAQVDASLSSLRLTAENGEKSTCATLGTPYTAGMTRSDCSITFERSTANLPVKAGQTLPTSTLTATATWEASWTSSLDATPRPLEMRTTTTTAEIPVAEVQTVVTR